MMHLRVTTGLFSAILLLLGLSTAPAAAPVAPAAANKPDDPASKLGDRFSSLAAGISFCPPAGAYPQRRVGIGSEVTSEIVQFSNRDEKWGLKVSRLVLYRATRLLSDAAETDPLPLAGRGIKPQPAILDEAVRQLLMQNAGAKILRKDLANIGTHDVGLITSRFTQSAQSWLRQQAFLKGNDLFYYIFDFTTPSGHTSADKDTDEDPSEAMAVQVFNAILDSVQLLDQRPLIEDNKERLYRTRALHVGLPKRLRDIILPEQYFRVLRDGKDIGWSFVCEDIGQRQDKDGVYVAVQSYGQPDATTKIALNSEMFAALDFKSADEAWLSVTTVTRGDKTEQITEIGQSDRRLRRIFDEKTGDADEADRNQPKMRPVEQYNLVVTQTTQANDQRMSRQPQVTRKLPPFYLPQAISWMLPRALPLNESKTYLFVSWVASEQELIYRYVDVERERDIKFNGRTVRAVTVKDRVGLEGEVTLHYLTPDGKYLGSYSPSTSVTVVACDLDALKKIWPETMLARPRLLDAPTEKN